MEVSSVKYDVFNNILYESIYDECNVIKNKINRKMVGLCNKVSFVTE